MQQWFETPPGRYLLAWERAEFDRAVATSSATTRCSWACPNSTRCAANRMPHKWLACDGEAQAAPAPRKPALSPTSRAAVRGEQPRPGGAAAFAGIEPGPARHAARGRARAGARGQGGDLLPQSGQPLGPAPAPRPPVPPPRLRRAVTCRMPATSSATGGCATGCGFSVSRSRPAASAATGRRSPARSGWNASTGWTAAGERSWPIFGAVYFIVAVKRVRGIPADRPAWKPAKAPATAPVPVTNRSHRGARTTLTE
jgi:hypothetical protein